MSVTKIFDKNKKSNFIQQNKRILEKHKRYNFKR